MTTAPISILAAALALALGASSQASALALLPTGTASDPAPLFHRADIKVDEMPPLMREAFIRGIQEELAEHGYDAGPADGVIGGRTRQAIRDYQRDAGLPNNGEATKELLDHLKFVTPKVLKGAGTPRALPSMLVESVQKELALRGYYKGRADGLAGPATRGAVRDFQRDSGLPVTGVIDDRLLSDLRLAAPSVRAPARL